MSTLIGFLIESAWFLVWPLVIFVFPYLLGIGICRALRVRDFGNRLGWVLISIAFLGFAPFLFRVVQEEQFTYQRPDATFVSVADLDEVLDPVTGQPAIDPRGFPKMVLKGTGEAVTPLALSRRDITYSGGKWVLVQPTSDEEEMDEDATDRHDSKKKPPPPIVEVIKRRTFKLSRWKDAIALGIDLAGGTNLVYELKDTTDSGEQVVIDSDLMQRMVAAVTKRVNPAGTKEIVVRAVGRNRIEVILPGADPAVVEETKKLMTKLGTLEFSIVANRKDHPGIIESGLSNQQASEVFDSAGRVIARWRPIAPDRDERGRERPSHEFDNDGEIALRQLVGKPPGFKEILIINQPDESRQITGRLLKRANPTADNSGRPAVGFHFNQLGGILFNDLTTEYKPRKDGSRRRLAVMLNGEVHTAPSINQPIGADGIIESSRFRKKEVDHYVSVLNAGALPVPIKETPISEFTISPTLGVDVQSKGELALWSSTIAVIVFMAGYYFVAGLVADFALLLNLVFIVGIMAWIQAAFTLPGLAGLVLSAGMAVDSNVLIYERIREELGRGASLRMAIHNGFDKAFVAIFDSHITTLLTAIILYLIGTETVKGFAVSLFIGLVMNLYTAVFISRVIMNILERARITKRLRMLSMIGVTNLDFVGKQTIALTASTLLIVVGLAAFFVRGASNYDIDFTGGISVTMQFNEPQDVEKVRESLENTFGKNITVEELTPSGTSAKGIYYRLRVANEGESEVVPKDVESKVNQAFPGILVRKSFTFGEIKPIVASNSGEKDDDGENLPAPAAGDPFAGGHQVQLDFTDAKGEKEKNAEIAPATFARYLEDQLGSIPLADQPDSKKYPAAETLFQLVGTGGSGLAAREGTVRAYSAMLLKASPAVDSDDLKTALATIQKTMENTPVFDEVTSFESSVAGETKQSALIAIFSAMVALIVYIWFRFENVVFGLAAVVAVFHDVLVTVGCVALASYLSKTPVGPALMLTDFKVNMPMIAAFLTIVGYSLNDTIVIFDRLREIRGKNPVISKEMINLTVNQTLSRTILTALTVFISVLILYLVGGEGIHGFAFCMVVGSIVGTYSTVYIASPLVLVFLRQATGSATQRKPISGPEAAPA